MLYFFLEDASENVPYPTHTLFIQDGNALFHAMTNLPPTHGAIFLHVLDQMIAEFQLFLANEDNKKQLCDILLWVWGSKAAASRLNKSGMSVVVVMKRPIR